MTRLGQPYEARIATTGLDGNGLWWWPKALREAAPKFNAAQVFLRHQPRWGPATSTVIAHVGNVRYVGDDRAGYLAGLIYPTDQRLGLFLAEAASQGIDLGLSLAARTWKVRLPGGHHHAVGEIVTVNAVDLVAEPAMPGCCLLTESDGHRIPPSDWRAVALLAPERAEQARLTHHIERLETLRARLEAEQASRAERTIAFIESGGRGGVLAMLA